MTQECRKFQSIMEAHDIEGALIVNPQNICYLSGASLPLRTWAGPTLAGGPALAFIDAHNTHPGQLIVANTESWTLPASLDGFEVVRYEAFDSFKPYDAMGNYAMAVRQTIKKMGLRAGKIGVDQMTPHVAVSALHETFPASSVVEITHLLLQARRVKTANEVEKLRRAASIGALGQKGLMEFARPGITELELWDRLLLRMEENVGHTLLVSGELVSGPRTAVVQYPGGPTPRKLLAGDTVILDLSVCVDGYWTDTTNTIIVGKDPTLPQIQCYRAALDAFNAGLGSLRVGARCCDVEASARNALAQHGFKPMHYMGHQLGASVNEPPRLVQYDSTFIEASMVFALEPGAYQGPGGDTGARLEQNILITEDGPEILSAFPWGLNF